MTMSRCIALFASAGSAISMFLLGLWWVLPKIGYTNLWASSRLDTITLLFWPSSFFLMATENQTTTTVLQIMAASIAVNILLYSLIGLLMWYGINKQRWVLYATVGVIAIGWYKLLKL